MVKKPLGKNQAVSQKSLRSSSSQRKRIGSMDSNSAANQHYKL